MGELQQQMINIPKTFGFSKPVGSTEKLVKTNQPDFLSQKILNDKFGVCTSTQVTQRSTMRPTAVALGSAALLMFLLTVWNGLSHPPCARSIFLRIALFLLLLRRCSS